MAFVSRNPKIILNPEVAEGYISVEPKNLEKGQSVIGFYKNLYTDPVYKNKCYVLKGKDDGVDYLLFGCASLHEDMKYYSQGDLLCAYYDGKYITKKGPFAGKEANIWKVTCESTWIPAPEFVAQLQNEVINRRQEVINILSQNGTLSTANLPIPQSINPYAPQIAQPQAQVQPLQAVQQPQYRPTAVAPVSSVPKTLGKKTSSDPFV